MLSARFVLSSEIPESRRLNESLIKDLTGGDTITARQLYQNPFTFAPSHKLWLSGNHKPRISGTDEGIWRRIRVVPFKYTFPKDQRKKMSDVLDSFKAEKSGILTWMVVGGLMWQDGGLSIPQVVDEATADYRNDQDLVRQFLEEKCEINKASSINKDALYRAWREWCEAAGENEAAKKTKKWLTHQLISRGFEHGGGGNSNLMGIDLK